MSTADGAEVDACELPGWGRRSLSTFGRSEEGSKSFGGVWVVDAERSIRCVMRGLGRPNMRPVAGMKDES